MKLPVIHIDKIDPIQTPLEGIKMKSSKGILVVDIEAYPNYILVGTYNPQTGDVRQAEVSGLSNLIPFKYQETWQKILKQYCVITFYGHNYDIPVLNRWCYGAKSVREAFLDSKQVQKEHQLVEADGSTRGLPYPARKAIAEDHIDLYAIAGFKTGGLKKKANNLCCPRVLELPIEADTDVPEKDMPRMREYNIQDLYNTGILLANYATMIRSRIPLIPLINQDVRDHSDSECARELFKPMWSRGFIKENGLEVVIPTHPRPWNNPIFQEWEDALRRVTIETEPITTWGKPSRELVYQGSYEDICRVRGGFYLDGRAAIPKGKIIEEDIGRCHVGPSGWNNDIGAGSGGVHYGIDKTVWSADDTHEILEMDVSSYYYPALILKQEGRYLPDKFYEVYRDLYNKRIKAKDAGESIKALSYKIILNSVFGRLKYYSSVTNNLCNFELYINIVHPGHYYMFRLMDTLEAIEGVRVFYMNTDGVKVYLRRRKRQEVNKVLQEWRDWSGFLLPVNNAERVIMATVSGFFSKKGQGYSSSGFSLKPNLKTTPSGYVIDKGIVEYFLYGTQPLDYVRKSHNLHDFMLTTACKGKVKFEVGGVDSPHKMLRYYYTNGEAQTVLRCGVNKSRVEKDYPKKLITEVRDIERGNINHEVYAAKIEKELKKYRHGGLHLVGGN